jgi:hypothetical protein
MYIAYATALEDTEQFLWGEHVMKFVWFSTKYPLTAPSYCAGCRPPRSARAPEWLWRWLPGQPTAPLHSLRWSSEAPSSRWWLPPSAGCYWRRWDHILNPRLAFLLIQYLLLVAWMDSSLHEFSFRLILAADVDKFCRLDILHSAINLECHAKWYWWCWVG